MYANRLISFMLVSMLALAAANPLVAERETCDCESPTGCPGLCSADFLCVGYCGMDTSVYCNACTSSGLSCIMSTDGSCFTVVE
ncbi:hypothetical protein K438DRAFT_1968041 [Mycena galopus ATCC 62051]|nr:hypothetical protein K438DRAFT_1968041 [Mycena galopus ATCC 62051]